MKTYIFLCSVLMLSACVEPATQPTELGDPAVVWSYDRDKDFTVADIVQPVIVGELVFLIHDNRLVCRELKTGVQKWVTKLENRIFISTRRLIYANGKLYFNWGPYVYAYEAQTGKQLWRTHIQNFKHRGMQYNIINEQHLFIPGIMEIARLNLNSGEVDLRIPLTDLVPKDIAQHSGSLVLSEDSKLYVPTGYYRKGYYIDDIEGSVLCYSAETGKLIWGHKIENKRELRAGEVDSTYRGAGTQEVSIYGDFLATQAGSTVYLFNRHTGKIIWEHYFKNDGFFSLGVKVWEDKVYASSTRGFLYCFSATDGRILWKVDTKYSLIAVLNIHGNRLYFCNDGGSGIWVVDKDSGKVIWNGHPPEYEQDQHYSFFSPVETDGRYMVNVGQWKIYCLTVPK